MKLFTEKKKKKLKAVIIILTNYLSITFSNTINFYPFMATKCVEKNGIKILTGCSWSYLGYT